VLPTRSQTAKIHPSWAEYAAKSLNATALGRSPDNTNDQQVLAEVWDDLRDWKPGRVITVVDRGFSSADNLAYLRRAGGHYIAGMRMRDGNLLVDQVLARQGRY
jgi:hypothetical protein